MNKKFRLNSRNLFLTYPRCYYSKQELFIFLEHKLDIQYCLIAQETHEDGALHLHAYVQLKDKCNFSSPKCLDFNGIHGNYVSAKGYYQDNYNYLTKEDQLPFEYGEPNKAKNKSEETKQGIRERNEMLATKDLVSLVKEGEIRIENYLNVKKSVMAYKMDSITIGGYQPLKKCFWICDQPEKGKSRRVRELEIPFYTKPLNKWWDGYKQEPVVMIEDFDKKGECLSHYLKIWADCYSFYGEYKGGTVPCNFTILIVTANYWPNEIWSEENDPQLIKAIDRRFTYLNTAEYDAEHWREKIIAIVNQSML